MAKTLPNFCQTSNRVCGKILLAVELLRDFAFHTSESSFLVCTNTAVGTSTYSYIKWITHHQTKKINDNEGFIIRVPPNAMANLVCLLRSCNSPVYCEEIVKTRTCNSPARLHSQAFHFYPSWSFEHYKSYHSRQAQPEDVMRKKKIKTNALHSTSINNHVVLLHNHGNSKEKFQSTRCESFTKLPDTQQFLCFQMHDWWKADIFTLSFRMAPLLSIFTGK